MFVNFSLFSITSQHGVCSMWSKTLKTAGSRPWFYRCMYLYTVWNEFLLKLIHTYFTGLLNYASTEIYCICKVEFCLAENNFWLEFNYTWTTKNLTSFSNWHIRTVEILKYNFWQHTECNKLRILTSCRHIYMIDQFYMVRT